MADECTPPDEDAWTQASADPYYELPIPAMPIAQLVECWQTLTRLSEQYHSGGEGWDALIRARRFVEIEMREQHGDAVALPVIEGLH